MNKLKSLYEIKISYYTSFDLDQIWSTNPKSKVMDFIVMYKFRIRRKNTQIDALMTIRKSKKSKGNS